MELAIYIRVSTEDQAKEGYSLEVQREYLESFAKREGFEIFKVYQDDGISGYSIERPALNPKFAIEPSLRREVSYKNIFANLWVYPAEQVKSLTRFNLAALRADFARRLRQAKSGLKELLKDAKEKKFDLVLVYKIDRFNRN